MLPCGIFPLQVKEYPGFNFIGLIFGRGGENQKRLEKVRSLFCQLYKIVLMICEFLSTNLVPCSHFATCIPGNWSQNKCIWYQIRDRREGILW